MSNRYGLYSATFDAGATTLPLTQLRSMGTRPNKSMVTVHPSGNIDPAAHIMSMARPIMQFGSRDLGKIFGHTTPVSISAGLFCTDPSTFMYRQRVAGGAFSSGSDNVTQIVEDGFLHCTEISADSESNDGAQAALEFIALSATGINPFTTAASQAVPGALSAPAFSTLFFHGPAYLNSVALPGLIGTRVRPGISFTSRLADGGVFPTTGLSSITSRNPQIDLTFLKIDMIPSTLDMVCAAFATTLAVYFRKGAAGAAGRVADATSEHIKISAAAGSWGPDDVSVSDENDVTTTITVMPTGVLSLSAASAIP